MGIISKASELSSPDVIVFGELASGRTTALANYLEEGQKVLWVSFGNLVNVPRHVDVASPISWEEFTKEIVLPTRKGELVYDVIVIEGLNTLAQMSLPDKATQQDWAVMGKDIFKTLLTFRNLFGRVLASADVVQNDEGQPQIGFNRDLYNKIMPFFGVKAFTHTLPEMKDGKATGKVSYLIQTNGAMALRLRPIVR